MRNLIIFLCLLTMMLLPVLVTAQKPAPGDAILGTWFNEEKDAKIDVYKVEGKYFGKVIWLKNPLDENGKPKTDTKNSNKSLRTRTRLGLIVLTGLIYKEGAKYEKGKIYDPKSGNTYSCFATLVNRDKLKLRGYIGVSIMGRTSEWTRTE